MAKRLLIEEVDTAAIVIDDAITRARLLLMPSHGEPDVPRAVALLELARETRLATDWLARAREDDRG